MCGCVIVGQKDFCSECNISGRCWTEKNFSFYSNLHITSTICPKCFKKYKLSRERIKIMKEYESKEEPDRNKNAPAGYPPGLA